VYRWYRVKAPQTLPWDGVYLNNLDDLHLNDARVLPGYDDDPEAGVAGIFWGWSDHPYNAANCPLLTTDFTIDKVNRLVKFEHPVFQFGGSDCIQEATLGLYTSFRLRDSTTGCWYKETYSTERTTGSGERTYVHSDLWRCRAAYYVDCPPSTSESDNESELADEANAYVNNYAAHWDAVATKRVLEYPGMQVVVPNGKVHQVCWRINKNQPTTTIASEGFEQNALLR
jgi:hypothetical protein